MTRKRGSLIVAALALAAITLFTSSSTARTSATTLQLSPTEVWFTEALGSVNATLAAGGSNYLLDRVEYLTSSDGSDEVGQTVFFNNRTKQLGVHFVPGDPRR